MNGPAPLKPFDTPCRTRSHDPIVPPASLLRATLLVAFASALAACGRTPPDLRDRGPTVDGWIYAYGFCSFKCHRLEQCGLAGEVSRDACETACIDDALETLSGDPCWAQWIELRRCHVRRTDCEDVEAEAPTPSARAQCERRAEELDACEQ
jgi:hypothetical protein